MWTKVVESQASAPAHLLHLTSLASGERCPVGGGSFCIHGFLQEWRDGADVLEVCWLENQAAWASADGYVSMFYTHVESDQNQQ